MALPSSAQAQQVRDLLATLEPRIREALLEAIRAQADRVDFAALVDALVRGDMAAAAEMLRIDNALLWPISEAVRGAYVAGGQMVGTTLPKGLSGLYAFDGRHVRAEAWMREAGATLIQGIVEDTMQATRAVVTEGLAQGRNPRAVALEIVGRQNPVTKRREGGIVGLTAEQADWAMRAREELLSGDPARMRSYLGRKRRDRRFDGMVSRAIKEGRALSVADADRLVGRYKDRLLKMRGDTIASTEAHMAVAEGRAEGYRQLLDRPDVEAIRKTWSHGLSREPREDHLALSGTVLPFSEDFVMGDGTRMSQPGDPRGGARHNVSCRCVAIVRVVLRKD